MALVSDYCAISTGIAPLQNNKLSPAYLTSIAVALLGHHRGDAPVEALQSVGTDEDAEAERSQTCCVVEDLHRAR